MADTLLLRAIQGHAKSVNLSCKKLSNVPKIIGSIKTVLNIDLKGNNLSSLPDEFGGLTQLEILNLGNNSFKFIPQSIGRLYSLHTLHLFNNSVETIPDGVLTNLRCLCILNLNNNSLTKLPKDICKLISLEKLSIDNNKLKSLPIEICALSKLKELRISKNRLERLPLEIGFLSSLEELHVPLNKLRELPESIGKCYNLKVLDIAANDLSIFPTETHHLPLEELHCEENPLLSQLPVQSIQEEEVLTLKEITARYIMRTIKDRFSSLRRQIHSYPDLKPLLSQSSNCAVCGQPFLNTWLECVRFVSPKVLKLKCQTLGQHKEIPIRALLCSYTCFNKKTHDFYGVAFP